MSHEFESPMPRDREADVLHTLAIACGEIVLCLGEGVSADVETYLSTHLPLAEQAETYATIHDIHQAHMADVGRVLGNQTPRDRQPTGPAGLGCISTGRSAYIVSRTSSGTPSLFRLS